MARVCGCVAAPTSAWVFPPELQQGGDPPPVPILQASSAAVLPLGLRGQTLSRPRAVGDGIVPGDVQNGVVRPGEQGAQ